MNDGRQTGDVPTGPVPGPIGVLLSRVYEWVVGWRNRRFDEGQGVVCLDRPVISVGNLSVGGTGKTPMVGSIVRMLLAIERNPCIAMRGYKAGDGESDEAAAYRRSFPDVPVVAEPNRAAGLAALFRTPAGRAVDCVVLDDGFQHRQIARDLDIVLIDASRDVYADRNLPAGWLREPVDSLERADAVVLTHAEMVDARTLERLETRVAIGHGWPPIAATRHDWTELDVFENGTDRTESVEWMRERLCMAVCAIGNPSPFLLHAEDVIGRPLVQRMELRDHDPYAPRTVDDLITMAEATGVEAILTTDKDWSKLRKVSASRWPCAVVRPRLVLSFVHGERSLAALVESSLKHPRTRSRTPSG